MAQRWTLEAAPALTGKLAVVTGANSGLGLETARALRAKGAEVVFACRNEAKASRAIEQLESEGPGPRPSFVHIDLEVLDSVAAAAKAITAEHRSVDLLINNAGIFALPGEDGPMRQLMTNLLGPVALSAALLAAVEAASGRIIMVSSPAHRIGTLDRHAPLDLAGQSPLRAYSSSKLAVLLFCFEADRRLRAARAEASIRAAHPGWSRSELLATGPVEGRSERTKRLGAFVAHHFGQRTERGALPMLRAALDPSIPPGAYVGPDGFLELFGEPTTVGASRAATDPELAAALFDAALLAVGASWPSAS
jgi:NAD(P)-dependent dehydrogenase (short-subunit alcohol dehydrogenase family)